MDGDVDMDGFAGLDVAIVGNDVLWSVEAMNAVARELDGVNVEDFLAVAPALERLSPERPAVVVASPELSDLDLDDLLTLADARPELGLVLTGADPAALAGRVAGRGDHRTVATGDVAALVAAVDQLLLDRRSRGPWPGAGGDVDLAGEGSASERLVVVTGGKGGVGRTTLAINLAATLARRRGGRVALIDACAPIGDVPLLLGLPAPVRYDIDDFTITEDSVLRLAAEHPDTGLLVISPPTRSSEFEGLTPAQLLELVLAAAAHAEVVVVDAPLPLVCAAGMGPASALTALVTTTQSASLKNALIARDLLGAGTPVGIVVDEPAPDLPHAEDEDLERVLDAPVIGRLPFDERFHRGTGGAQPSALAADGSDLGDALERLAEEVDTLLTPAAG